MDTAGNDVPLRTALRELKSLFPKTRFVFASYWSIATQSIKERRESELEGWDMRAKWRLP